MKIKTLALTGLIALGGFTAAQAQTVTSGTAVVIDNPTLVGMGANLGVAHVSSSVATSMTFTVPNARNLLADVCEAYSSAGKSKALTFTRNAETIAVNGNVSDTLAIGDQIKCVLVYRP